MSKNSEERGCEDRLSRLTLKSPAKWMFLFFSRPRVETSGRICKSLKCSTAILGWR